MLTREAQNALLKTLEEPDVHKLLILITHEADRLLPTIQSRSERSLFNFVSQGEYTQLFPDMSQKEREEIYTLLTLENSDLMIRVLD